MKFNFKKIASVLTGAVMLSSTVALAAAANFPAPFVQSGAGDYAVVYGSAAVAGTDNVAAADINAFLSGKVTTVTPQPVPTNLSLSGEVVPLFKSNNKINLGDGINEVVDDVDYNQLPTVLAQGVFTDEDGNEYDYDQKVYIGGALDSLPLTHFANSKVNANKEPVIGFDITNDEEVLEYEITFNDALNSSSSLLATQKIELLGKEWYISKVENTGSKITLLDTSNEITMIEGSTQTITVGDKSYEITIDTVESDGDVTVKVGANTYTIAEGNSKKVATSPDTYLAITNSIYSEKKDSKVTFTLGSGELVIQNGARVTLNGETVKGLSSTITQDADDKITAINIVWAPTEDTFLVPGKELVFPAFGGVKLSYTGFTLGTEEVMKVAYSGDDGVVLQDLELKDGDYDELPLAYLNATGTGFEGLGEDAENTLVTDAADTLTLTLAENPLFVATWVSDDNDEWESYIFQLSDIQINDDDNVTSITNEVTGAAAMEFTITGTERTPERDIGEITLTVQNATEDDVEVVVSSSSGAGEVYTNVLVTKGGLWIDLPVTADVAGATSYDINFTEADNEATTRSGSSFQVTVAPADQEVEVTDITGATGVNVDADSDNEEYYIPGELATKILYTAADDRPTATITYHTTESYANVYIAEAGASTGTSGGSGGSSGWLPVKDTEVSGVSSKNLVVVGGSCVNTVAAKLLGSDTPLCEAAWMTATNNVGAGSFLIQTFANPWATGKVATLVAGYDSTDTTNAVNALKVETIDTTVGKKYVKLAGSTLQLV